MSLLWASAIVTILSPSVRFRRWCNSVIHASVTVSTDTRLVGAPNDIHLHSDPVTVLRDAIQPIAPTTGTLALADHATKVYGDVIVLRNPSFLIPPVLGNPQPWNHQSHRYFQYGQEAACHL